MYYFFFKILNDLIYIISCQFQVDKNNFKIEHTKAHIISVSHKYFDTIDTILKWCVHDL